MAAILSDRAAITAMLRVEAELARAQADLGIILPEAAERIAHAAERLHPDPGALVEGVARAMLAAQLVIAALKTVAGDAGDHAHYGATSHDIVDTGLSLQLAQALDLLAQRLAAVQGRLAEKAARYASLPIPARNRHQIAAPTTLGAKIAVPAGDAGPERPAAWGTASAPAAGVAARPGRARRLGPRPGRCGRQWPTRWA